jgi:hypothetical protein
VVREWAIATLPGSHHTFDATTCGGPAAPEQLTHRVKSVLAMLPAGSLAASAQANMKPPAPLLM